MLYAGTLGRVNRVSYLVHVADAIRQIDPEVRIVVVGSGSETEGVRALARDLEVLDRNFFLLPSQPKQLVVNWFSAADVCCSVVDDIPALWANSANKFFDALAAGRPIAINHRGWQADVIENHDIGLVLDPHDAGLAARVVAAKLADRAWLKSAGARARALAETEYSCDLLASKLERVLMNACLPAKTMASEARGTFATSDQR